MRRCRDTKMQGCRDEEMPEYRDSAPLRAYRSSTHLFISSFPHLEQWAPSMDLAMPGCRNEETLGGAGGLLGYRLPESCSPKFPISTVCIMAS